MDSVAWAKLAHRLVQELPCGDHGPLHALSVAFNKQGASSLKELLSMLDTEGAFTGPNSEESFTNLLRVLESWSNIEVPSTNVGVGRRCTDGVGVDGSTLARFDGPETWRSSSFRAMTTRGPT